MAGKAMNKAEYKTRPHLVPDAPSPPNVRGSREEELPKAGPVRH